MRNKIFWSLIFNSIIVLTFFNVGCTDDQLKKNIQEYCGDGAIKYLKGPTLGISGLLIQMEPMNLSLGQNQTYNLCKIPKGNDYTIYLVIDDNRFETQVIKGLWTIHLELNKKSIINVSSALENTIESQTRGIKKYYFEREGSFDVKESSCDCSLEVRWEGTDPPDYPVQAYIEISRGGFK